MGAFLEINKTKINEKKNLVISKMGDDKVAIAQQLMVDDGCGKEMQIFLKNSIVTDLEGLKRISLMIDETINILEA